ncbi:allophanate hydrolase [Thiomicrorhabdus immobilis]|uniref:Allophanate hydrolase n=1 Tax=Thiomicrorhabdus immobilis TaxID=2791037 RepID=A0ABM7MCG9_9GAMM|nr:allophanate hydrolase [Thiomicrorhabdus immobilis]BCN93072.1 allophanate hydrolase [Thiomicrorhabdus immobilis]
MREFNLTLSALHDQYASGELTPRNLVQQLIQNAHGYADYNLFIHLLTPTELEPYLSQLDQSEPNSLPLWGIPFVIKDNIDLANIPTTAACKEFSYVPSESATVVQQLIDAGAIPIAKANMDQFATGLVGTRSPYGVCHNAFDFEMISGGSSSGSAVSLALNLCSFSLGTDTAGSGRVPAAFNNLVGLKPSKGLLSTHGVVPAVRSQDVVSVFALNAQDAYSVFDVAAKFDEKDAFSRSENRLTSPAWPSQPVIGIPDRESLFFDGDSEAQKAFEHSVSTLKNLGYEIKSVPFQAWLDTAKLLYGGAWVAERYLAIQDFFETHENQMDPAVAKIIGGAKSLSAVDAYQGAYALQQAQRATQIIWENHGIDCFMTPTTPTIYSIEALQNDPIGLNSKLGTYTNFMNLLDYAAIAMPTGFRADTLPTGVTFFAPAGSDRQLMQLTDSLHKQFVENSGARFIDVPESNPAHFTNQQSIALAVVGAHLVGFPLNSQLLERGAKLLKTTKTAPKYQFFELPGGPILKPGLVKQANENEGQSIEVEVWAMPKEHLGSFLALIPSPLGLGKVELEDGSQVVGFICEPYGIEGATDISATGGWRNWMKQRKS